VTRGRKNKYDEVILPRLEEIKKLLAKGTSEKEIANYLGISYTTWKTHKRNIPSFSTVVKDSRRKAIDDLENAMFTSALGFTKKIKKAMKLKEVVYENGKRLKEIERIEFYEEEVYIPPSVACMQFLLKNWAKERYSNNPAELEVKKKEFELNKKVKEDQIF
jgi:Response regulator containing a CheY-like receiver domain and an HTH DNA-binding domain